MLCCVRNKSCCENCRNNNFVKLRAVSYMSTPVETETDNNCDPNVVGSSHCAMGDETMAKDSVSNVLQCENGTCGDVLLMDSVNGDDDDIPGGENLLPALEHITAPSICLRRRLSVLTIQHGNALSRFVKELLSPSQTQNNVKFLGSKRAVEIEKERSKNGYAIHPLSSFRQYWDLLVMIVMFVNLFLIPLDMAFLTDTFEVFIAVSDMLCVVDIMLNFRTGYSIRGTKTFELRGWWIATHYLKTWFIVDLISSLPLHHVVIEFHGRHESFSLGLKSASHALKYIRILKLVRLLKLLRLSRIFRAVLIYEEVYRITTGFMRYIKLISMMMIMAHWNGCIQFLIPMLQDFPEKSWVVLCGIKEEKWYIQYGWALFKTLSHMLCIGYGRFIPRLLSEASITIFTMVTGATFYALFIASAMAYMIETEHSKISYLEKDKKTKEYLAFRQIPNELRQRVESYFHHRYHNGRCFDEGVILSELSKPIRTDIVQHICRDMIINVPFLKCAPADVISSMLDVMSCDVYLDGDVITQEGRMESKLFFIRDGEVEIIVNNRIIERLQGGDYFGEILFIVEEKAFYTAKATTICDIVTLSDDFKVMLEQNETMKELSRRVAIERILNIYHQCHLTGILQNNATTLQSGVSSCHTKSLKFIVLFKRHIEYLLNTTTYGPEDEEQTTRLLKETNSEIESLFLSLAQSHIRTHDTCTMPESLTDEDNSSD